MSNYVSARRKRRQSLLIVEGEHEKNKLFWLIFRCFPEIDIDMETVWIYGTNIYMLYNDITKEYGAGWTKQDVDFPFVVSKKQGINPLRYKQDFTNIIMVFDYERHEPNFVEEKIMEMQTYFGDATDVGMLYINYPMVESYEHLKMLPDDEYAERKISVALRPGKKYKELVKKESMFYRKPPIFGVLELPEKINDFLEKGLGIAEKEVRKRCRDGILDIADGKNIEETICKILQGTVAGNRLQTVKYQMKDWMEKSGYVCYGQTYWEYMRNILQEIIWHNICKANRIQHNYYPIKDERNKECLKKVDFVEILKEQNTVSQNCETGFIWVLNTCVLFVAEYNFALLGEIL